MYVYIYITQSILRGQVYTNRRWPNDITNSNQTNTFLWDCLFAATHSFRRTLKEMGWGGEGWAAASIYTTKLNLDICIKPEAHDFRAANHLVDKLF